jgi:hypothetical protein
MTAISNATGQDCRHAPTLDLPQKGTSEGEVYLDLLLSVSTI